MNMVTCVAKEEDWHNWDRYMAIVERYLTQSQAVDPISLYRVATPVLSLYKLGNPSSPRGFSTQPKPVVRMAR